MKKIYSKLLMILLLISVLPLTFKPALAQDVIQVISTDIENNFPDSLTFYLTVRSEKPIERIKLYFKIQGQPSTQSQPVDFEPSESVTVSYTWDTSMTTIPPSTPLTYYWQITDQDGNRHETPEELMYYDDLRFNWLEQRSPELVLRWYEGDLPFGKHIFDFAQKALTQMKTETDWELDFPIIILIYANEQDFASWQVDAQEWAGGRAFPALGVTTQIVPPWTGQMWIGRVIPHEIAHLFFYQVVSSGTNYWPTWLDEGLAQYYEISPNDDVLTRVSQAARDGELLPLVLISGSFGSDPQRVGLAYDESYAVVVYMIETWGKEGLQRLVTGFRDGKGYREAVESAFGISWEEFEAGWITWLGVPTTPAPPPTATPTMISLKAPEGWPTPTKKQTETPTPTLVQPTATKTPTILPKTATPTATPTASPQPVGVDPWPYLSILSIICVLGLLVAGVLSVLIVLLLFLRTKKEEKDE